MKSVTFKTFCSFDILFFNLAIIMLSAIYFNYQIFTMADKIDNEASYGLLSAKFHIINLPVSQFRPKKYFSVGLPGSQAFREIQLVSDIYYSLTLH
jgi:hypothetical protein